MTTSVTLIATTAFGLEAVVKRELAALGYAGAVTGPGAVEFAGDLTAICRVNLWLRSADRVLVQIARFPAPDFDALFETTQAIAWSDWIPPDGEFPVVGRSHKSQLTSVPACQRSVKRAIVESLFRGHQVSELPESGGLFKIHLAISEDQATLSLDTTGASLHKRGYRLQAGEAPLKETLAAALVQLSFWDRERPLLDPFCGSGTIPIEAALLGRNLAPGLGRDFAAQGWPLLPQSLWEDAIAEARDLVQPPFEERLIGTDINPRAVEAARLNAQQAGVADVVHFQERPFDQLSSKRKFGCLITNPPYGERLGEQRALEPLYASMPEVLRKLPSWSHFILTAHSRFEALVGRPADRRRKLYNGRIECTYFQFHGPVPPRAGQPQQPQPAEQSVPAPIGEETASDDPSTLATGSALKSSSRQRAPVQPAFGALTGKADTQAEVFASRLRKLARHLRRWPTRRGITCYRLYERDVPGIPLVVDRYEDHLHISEYEGSFERDAAQQANWLDLMVDTAAEALEVPRRKIFLKRRQRQRGNLQHEHLDQRQYEITAHEGGLEFIVNLSDYVDTGLFLDHRLTREMVRDEARGKRFLNLFGYTGAFTVYAAAGGAAQTTTVDWTRAYLDWAARNLTANGLDSGEHELLREDARDFLRRLPQQPLYDLAVVDPPTFSNSKRTDEDWDVQHGHVDLLNRLLQRMSAGGVVYFSTNFRRFKFDPSLLNAAELREISQKTVPEDFRNRRIHRCWRMIAR